MKLAIFKYSSVLFALITSNILQAQTITQIQQNPGTSIRGLSVVDNNIAWVSGSKGYIGITRDGGKTWFWQQIKGFEKADFRDIEAFSDKEAVIMSSGTPALILKTLNGSATWQVSYRNTDASCFLDAMDFFGSHNGEGWVLGDPVNNKFLLLLTPDGGKTWAPYNNTPSALSGEAAFAASGTCLRTIKHDIFIVSGGSSANMLTSNRKQKKWRISPLPLLKGKSSQGSFSIAKGKNRLVVVGGDYQQDKRKDSTVCYSMDSGLTWKLANNPPLGFQSCVEFINHKVFLSTGTPGSNITTDGGITWKKIDDISYNVCRKAKHGKLVLLAGNGGKIGVLKMQGIDN
jgi:photosystem II stability/assembly factor-like uncharacterized protein